MKRLAVFVCVLAISVLPFMVSAQGLPSLGEIPGIGSIFGNAGTYGQTTAGIVAPPTFYVGWLGRGKGAGFGVGFDQPLGAVSGIDQAVDITGLVLGISDTVTFSDRLSVILSGWWKVPATGRSFERYDIVGAPSAQRSWSAETNWWWLDALAACNLGSGVAVLGGFRFDRFEIRFRNPDPNFLFVPASIFDEANVKSNGYIPLLGIRYTIGSGGNVLTAYAVGFPTLLGRAEYHVTVNSNQFRYNAEGNYNEGYFFETRLDYTRRIMGEADLGAFFLFTAARGTFSGGADANIPAFFNNKDRFRGGLNRSAIGVGGTLNLPFRLPFL